MGLWTQPLDGQCGNSYGAGLADPQVLVHRALGVAVLAVVVLGRSQKRQDVDIWIALLARIRQERCYSIVWFRNVLFSAVSLRFCGCLSLDGFTVAFLQFSAVHCRSQGRVYVVSSRCRVCVSVEVVLSPESVLYSWRSQAGRTSRWAVPRLTGAGCFPPVMEISATTKVHSCTASLPRTLCWVPRLFASAEGETGALATHRDHGPVPMCCRLPRAHAPTLPSDEGFALFEQCSLQSVAMSSTTTQDSGNQLPCHNLVVIVNGSHAWTETHSDSG